MKKSQFEEIMEVLKVDILQAKLRGFISIGHNMLAGLTHFLSFLVFYHDDVEGRETTSSMVGGWKFEREDAFKQ